jgi:hypothetical protein
VIKKTTHQRCKSGHYFNITSLHRDLHSPKIIQSDSVRLKQIQNRIEEKTDRLRYSSVQVSKMFFHTVNFRRTKVFFTSSSEIGRSTKENKTTTKRNRNRSEEICKERAATERPEWVSSSGGGFSNCLGMDEGLLHYLLRVGLGLPPRDRRRRISNSRARLRGPIVSPNKAL